MDPDFEIAKQLQEEFNKEFQSPAPKTNKLTPKSGDVNLNVTQNLIHPEWEAIDPTPNIHILKDQYDKKFFQGKLVAVELEWSKQMYKCAGICYQRQNRTGFKACTIRLSEPLLKLRPRSDLVQTLLHEMIHAYLFVLNIREGNGGHGPNFHKIMHGINRQAGTNITVYHTFHDEVEVYQRHWWRCNGPCQKKAPYYGYVKRAVNRAPGPYDFWYSKHQSTCGGIFLKIKEPTPKKKVTKTANVKKGQTNKISKYFEGGKTGINRGGSTIVITKPTVARPIFASSPTDTTNKVNSKKTAGNLVNVIGFKDLKGDSPTTRQSKPPQPLFSGKGNTIGAENANTTSINLGAKRSRLLDQFDNRKITKKPKISSSPIELSDDEDDIILAVDLDAIEKENSLKSGSDARKSIIKQEIMDSNGFTDEDDIILIDDEFDDTLISVENTSDDLNLTAEVLDDLFGEDTLSKEDADRKSCIICLKEIRNSEHAAHLEKCYDDFLSANNHKSSAKPLKITIPKHDQPSTSQSAINHCTKTIKKENETPIEVENATYSGMVQCPVCPKKVKFEHINAHLDECMQE